METTDISTLKADPKNPRYIDKKDFEKLKTLLKEFGDLSGIVKNLTTGELVGGHMRINAFRDMGGDAKIQVTQKFETPTRTGTVAIGYVILDGEMFTYREVSWPAEKQSAANIAANRAGGDFDKDLLAQVVYELSQLENSEELLGLTALAEDEVNKLLDMVGANGESDPADDEAPEVDTVNPPVSKLGEIYQLGNHRLMCGDSTDFGAVSDLVDGTEIAMVWTDPPYNAAFSGRSGNHEVIMNDEMKPEEFKVFLKSFFEILYSIAPESTKYICTDWKMYPMVYEYLQKPSACIVWVKNMFGMGGGYRHQHELIVFEGSLEANDQSDVWEIKRDNGADYDHPTQKPVELSSRAIVNSSKRGDAVLDFFSGSGSSLIACEKTSRIFYGMELDPKYCDVIRKRYAKHTNQELNWQEATPVIQEATNAEPQPAPQV